MRVERLSYPPPDGVVTPSVRENAPSVSGVGGILLEMIGVMFLLDVSFVLSFNVGVLEGTYVAAVTRSGCKPEDAPYLFSVASLILSSRF
jgi:hypothetical protein